jgi:hypothetical protein
MNIYVFIFHPRKSGTVDAGMKLTPTIAIITFFVILIVLFIVFACLKIGVRISLFLSCLVSTIMFGLITTSNRVTTLNIDFGSKRDHVDFDSSGNGYVYVAYDTFLNFAWVLTGSFFLIALIGDIKTPICLVTDQACVNGEVPHVSYEHLFI